MKKFYIFAAAALVATAAMAQDAEEPVWKTGDALYATGGGGFDPQWAPESPAEFEFVGGEYVLSVTNIDGLKISTAKGDWDTFNAAAVGCKKVAEVETWTDIAPWGENTTLPWGGDYTIKVKGDLSQIWVSTTTPEPSNEPQYCFRGGMNDWNNDLYDWAFTTIDGEAKILDVPGFYKFTCNDDQEVVAGDYFKVAQTNTWNGLNAGNAPAGTVLLDDPTELEQGSNPDAFVLDEDWNGVCYLALNLDTTPAIVKIFFSNDKDAENPFTEDDIAGVASIAADNAAPVYYNLQGVRVANPSNGLYIIVKGNKATKAIIK